MARAVRVYEERLREGGHGGGRAASSQPAGDGLGARREGRRAGGQARTATGLRARARATGRQTGRPNLGRRVQLRRLRRTDATQRQLGSGASTEHRATADQGLQNNRRGGRADTVSLRADPKYESEKRKRKKKHIERGRKQVENLRADGLPLQAAAGRTVEMHKQLRFGRWSAPARAIPTGAEPRCFLTAAHRSVAHPPMGRATTRSSSSVCRPRDAATARPAEAQRSGQHPDQKKMPSCPRYHAVASLGKGERSRK